MADRDFYRILGVPRTATREEIQRAYRRLARENHPDVNKDPGAEDRFKDVSEAYDVLSDPDLRKRYDVFGADFRRVPDDVDPDTWAQAQARARTGGRARAGAGARGAGGFGGFEGFEGFGGTEGEEIDLEDLLSGMFGGRAGRAGRGRAGRGGRGFGPIPGADQEAELPLTVEEAYRGGPRSVTLSTLSGPGGTRQYEVNVPPGVTDGQRIRLAGQGGQGSDGAPPGDLYLVVRLLPHPRYRVRGRDIHLDLPLAPWEAALGATVAVDTPGGEAKVKVPPGTSSGRSLRLRGRGMPNPRGQPGDVYAEVRIVVPSHPSEEERRLWSELARISGFDPRAGSGTGAPGTSSSSSSQSSGSGAGRR
ncbi:curved DNA-binding protein [Actinopolymorpha cephalotaxi]|uniref:Curved DNA-binding protein n=1 Tax=Actinopolymorpha cephalotaxi TaxID=504797 RepID=A0A1I2RV61_9ACTN|nr:J domain-containing protein [Actinopolymorpha cephalotaxi]SFG44448.1 curved DNA-binding protein [Actinopolymorpha cephalotaxi]